MLGKAKSIRRFSSISQKNLSLSEMFQKFHIQLENSETEAHKFG